MSTPFNPHMERLLRAAVAHGSVVLDAGCGHSAATSTWLAERGCDVVGIDPRLPLAPSVLVEITGVRPGRLRLVADDLLTADLMPHVGGPFDVLALFGVLHYMESPSRAATLLERLASWARPGALLVASWLLQARPALAVHDGAWFPAEEVDTLLGQAGFQTEADWRVEITHAHGGPSHSHGVRYGAWRLEK